MERAGPAVTAYSPIRAGHINSWANVKSPSFEVQSFRGSDLDACFAMMPQLERAAAAFRHERDRLVPNSNWPTVDHAERPAVGACHVRASRPRVGRREADADGRVERWIEETGASIPAYRIAQLKN